MIRRLQAIVRVWWVEFHPWLYFKALFVKKDPSVIPEGSYCYTVEGRRRKPCKYLVMSKRGDWCNYCKRSDIILLNDLCKICGENEGWD